MLNEIQKQLNQGHDEKAAELSTLLLEQSLPLFISSLGVNLGLQLIREFTHLFANPWVRYLGGNILPFSGTVASAIKNPLSTATQIGTSIATSSLIYGLFSRVAPVKQTPHKDIEANAIEMKSLNPKEATWVAYAKLVTKEEKFQYISESDFIKIKEGCKEILTKLNEAECYLNKKIEETCSKIESDTIPTVVNTYRKILDDQSTVLQWIQQDKENYLQHVSLLDDDHSGAYQEYEILKNQTIGEEKEIIAKYTTAMNNLGSLFKQLEIILNKINHNLDRAEGFTVGANSSFASSDFQNNLRGIIETIGFTLSDIRNYVKRYSANTAGQKGKKEGILEGRQQAFETFHLENSLNSRRSKKTRAYFDNRSQSMISDTKTLSSASDESSVISTAGSSKDNETIQIVRPLLQSSF